MNHIWLSMMQGAYPSPYWLTLKHANQIGGHVKANEKGTPVAFKIVRKETLVNGKKETSAYAMIKHHYVYNVADQCEDITIPAMPVPA
jgi:antirestriction protein ArdC